MTPDDLVVTPIGLRFQGNNYPCTIGHGGITNYKREGDGATPAGVHSIVGMLYRPDRISKPAPWALPVGPGDLWSDDQTAEDYNMMVRAPYEYSHERLRRGDPLYDLIILTNWNWPYAIKGRGSAIFIHQFRRPGFPTEGCIALSRLHLKGIAERLKIHSRLIVLNRPT